MSCNKEKPNLSDIGFKETREIYPKLKEIAEFEHIPVNELLTRLMEDYVRIHKSGNPNYKLDNFIDNPGFKATPAFHASEESWTKYLKSLNNDSAWYNFDMKLEQILDSAKHFHKLFNGFSN